MEDIYTNDIEGAEGFQKYHNTELEDDVDVDYPESVDNEYEDECNCSDPGCPCGGWKRGGV